MSRDNAKYDPNTGAEDFGSNNPCDEIDDFEECDRLDLDSWEEIDDVSPYFTHSGEELAPRAKPYMAGPRQLGDKLQFVTYEDRTFERLINIAELDGAELRADGTMTSNFQRRLLSMISEVMESGHAFRVQRVRTVPDSE
jgi:hypothetical protein